MRILSYDIGIKNLAYCMAEYDKQSKKLLILEWNIINLIENEINSQQLCSHISKMRPYKPCPNIANFRLVNNEVFYCKTHVKKNYKFIKPIIEKTDILGICHNSDCNKKIKYVVDNVMLCPSHKKQKDEFFKKNYTLKKIKTISCSDYPIDKVADHMIEILDTSYQHLLQCDIVLLELQIMKSPRIKTISNYLSMYYRMNGKHYKKNGSNIQDVRYIMASSKLRFDDSNTEENTDNYKNRKKTGIENVNDYLTLVGDIENKEWFNSQKKKDDLADALLQILIFIKRENKKK